VRKSEVNGRLDVGSSSSSSSSASERVSKYGALRSWTKVCERGGGERCGGGGVGRGVRPTGLFHAATEGRDVQDSQSRAQGGGGGMLCR